MRGYSVSRIPSNLNVATTRVPRAPLEYSRGGGVGERELGIWLKTKICSRRRPAITREPPECLEVVFSAAISNSSFVIAFMGARPRFTSFSNGDVLNDSIEIGWTFFLLTVFDLPAAAVRNRFEAKRFSFIPNRPGRTFFHWCIAGLLYRFITFSSVNWIRHCLSDLCHQFILTNFPDKRQFPFEVAMVTSVTYLAFYLAGEPKTI